MEKLKFYNENDMFDGESFVSESIGRESVEADESVDFYVSDVDPLMALLPASGGQRNSI